METKRENTGRCYMFLQELQKIDSGIYGLNTACECMLLLLAEYHILIRNHESDAEK
jgi:hypothetical protein